MLSLTDVLLFILVFLALLITVLVMLSALVTKTRYGDIWRMQNTVDWVSSIFTASHFRDVAAFVLQHATPP